jgi:DNA-binding SARP family transcriptional activator
MTSEAPSGLYCSVLGPLEVRVAGRKAVIGAPKQRLLLAMMLCRVNMVVPSSQLLEALWGELPPPTARKNLQVYVSTLRKVVGDRIDFQGWGYRLHAERDEFDLLRFRELTRNGRNAIRSRQAPAAARLLGEAIQMWAEKPLAEFAHVPLIAGQVDQLTELFLSVYEDWVELEIQLGRPAGLLSGLDSVAAQFPARERVAAAKMTALAQCGRSTEALLHFQTLRRHLASELGIDPSLALWDLHQRILRGEISSRFDGGTSVGLPAPGPANQLPRDIADFVGRERELSDIVSSRATVTVITGELGIGKTTLALHAAHALAPEFPDGTILVSLRRPVAEIQREVLSSAGLSPGGVPDEALTSMWRSWLAHRKVLLVLDDAPDESSVRKLLPGTAASRALVTSRSQLSGVEAVQRVQLGELSPAQGIEFLGRMIGHERVSQETEAVLALFGEYGLSPLTLRLLGGRFARLARMPLSYLAGRLQRAGSPLDEFTVGDVSLRGLLDEQYQRLRPLQQKALRAAGTLATVSFSHDELATALRGMGSAAEPAIESLLEANLITIPDDEVMPRSMRYTIAPLARLYAAELHATG